MESVLPIAITPVISGSRETFVTPAKDSDGFFAHIWDHFVPHARNNYHPHIFSHRLTGLLSLLLVALKVFTLSALTFGPIAPVYSSAITPANIISLTNQSRTGYGIPDLKENSLLDKAAQAKADDMLAKGYFAHNTPDGKTPWDFIVAAGYNYITAGENLAVNFTEAENVETAWMNSPGHKANLLNKNFADIGIGISQGTYQGHEAIFVVQEFGTLAEQKIVLDDKPTPVLAQQVPVPAQAKAVSPAPKARTRTLAPTAVKSQTSTQALPAADPVPLALGDPQVSVTGNTVTVSAHASASAVKVLAAMGQEAVMLEPKADNLWSGSVQLDRVANGNISVVIKAYDVNGKTVSSQAAEFAGSTPANYQLDPRVKSAHVSLGRFNFDPHMLEQRFYLLFIAGILAGLILAIGVHRHIQHLSVIANGSFVTMLAALLFMGGLR